MGVLVSLAGLEGRAFASGGYPECYRAVDLAAFFGTTPEKISRIRARKKDRFPADFYLGAGIYTRAGVLGLAGTLRTKRAAEVSVEMLRCMFAQVIPDVH